MVVIVHRLSIIVLHLLSLWLLTRLRLHHDWLTHHWLLLISLHHRLLALHRLHRLLHHWLLHHRLLHRLHGLLHWLHGLLHHHLLLLWWLLHHHRLLHHGLLLSGSLLVDIRAADLYTSRVLHDARVIGSRLRHLLLLGHHCWLLDVDHGWITGVKQGELLLEVIGTKFGRQLLMGLILADLSEGAPVHPVEL